MAYPVLGGPALHQGPVVGAPSRSVPGQSPIEYRLLFLNHTQHTVSVGDRRGFKWEVPRLRDLEKNVLIVRLELTLTQAARDSVAVMIKQMDNGSSDAIKQLCAAIAEAQDRGLANRFPVTFCLDYVVDMEEIARSGGSAYLVDADVMISTLDPRYMQPHPYSLEGRLKSVSVAAPDHLDIANFAYSFDIIDNTGRTPPQWVNVASKVFRVEPKIDPTRRDGVYVTTTGDTITTEVVPLDAEKMAELGIYPSYQEALAKGDVQGTRKAELLAMEHELNQSKVSYQMLKNDNDRFKAQLDKVTAEADAEQKELLRRLEREKAEKEHFAELARLRAKDYYESRSYERKDNSEFIKLLPNIILGVGAIVSALASLIVAKNK